MNAQRFYLKVCCYVVFLETSEEPIPSTFQSFSTSTPLKRKAGEGKETSAKKKRTKKMFTLDEKSQFYQQLEDSVLQKEILLVDDQMPTTEEDITKQLKDIDIALASSSRSKMISYCLIGRNLKELQKRRGTGETFLNYVAEHLPAATYNKSQIYFLMSLFEFANEYKKLMFVTYSLVLATLSRNSVL